jgi:hypothetical protein
MSETLKELVVTNPSKTGHKKHKKGKKSAEAKAAKKQHRRRRNPGRKPGKARRSTRRRRNPGIDVMGSLAQVAGGALAQVVTQPVAHMVGSHVTNKIARGATRTGIATLLPAVAGMATKMVAPNLGAGMLGAAGSMGTAHLLNTIATAPDKPIELMQKAGFAQLGAPDEVFERDGVLFRRRSDGVEEALSGVGQEPIILQMDDGRTTQAVALGEFPDAGLTVAILPSGEKVLVQTAAAGPAMAGAQLGELVTDAPQMAGPDDGESALGDVGNDEESALGAPSGL